VATVALVDMVVLLVLDRVPGWSAVAPHTAFATIMGVVAIVSVMGVRADLRQHRIFVETANKQSA
jgi:hypothetical protein